LHVLIRKNGSNGGDRAATAANAAATKETAHADTTKPASIVGRCHSVVGSSRNQQQAEGPLSEPPWLLHSAKLTVQWMSGQITDPQPRQASSSRVRLVNQTTKTLAVSPT